MSGSTAKATRRELRRAMGAEAIGIVERHDSKLKTLDLGFAQALESLRADMKAMEARIQKRINERSMP